MADGDVKVYYLGDHEQVREAIADIDREITRTQRDLNLARQADRALAEIERLLEQMREIALRAREPDADREELAEQFESLRMRIDLIATHHRAGMPAESMARLKELLDSLGKAGPN